MKKVLDSATGVEFFAPVAVVFGLGDQAAFASRGAAARVSAFGLTAHARAPGVTPKDATPRATMRQAEQLFVKWYGN